jgi:NAD(P) transhydrogenase
LNTAKAVHVSKSEEIPPVNRQYDLAVIGSGPARQKAAIQGAKLGKRVAIVDRSSCIGGICIHHGAIPSKSLREAILYFTGFYHRQTYGARHHKDLTMHELMDRCEQVEFNETQVVVDQLERNGVDFIEGDAAFENEHTLAVRDTERSFEIVAKFIIVATGTTPSRPPSVPFEDGVIVDSNGLTTLKQLPKSLIVVGTGVIGTEYASMLALLRIQVTLIDQRPVLLDFVDQEIAESLAYHMRDIGVVLHLGEEVISTEKTQNGKVCATFKSGKRVFGDALLYAAGRQGATANIGLEKVGIKTDNRGRIRVNEHYQTNLAHIYAVGDVIGFPSLASSSMEQGRSAACHAFDVPAQHRPHLIPYGIYTVPEISMVGQNERQLIQEGVPYEIGIARYREIARGQILGDKVGMLKLLFHQDSRQLLGIHAIGQGATELIHIGQMAMAFHGTIDYFIENTFNYPTLAECYRVAALNGHNKVMAAG